MPNISTPLNITGTILSWAYASNNKWRDDVKGVKWESYGMRNGLPHEISIRCDSNSRTAGRPYVYLNWAKLYTKNLNDSIGSTEDFTIAAWCRIDTVLCHTIISSNPSPPLDGGIVLFNDQGIVRGMGYCQCLPELGTDETFHYDYESRYVPELERWNHYALVRKDGKVKLFLNGKVVADEKEYPHPGITNNSLSVTVSNDSPWLIGGIKPQESRKMYDEILVVKDQALWWDEAFNPWLVSKEIEEQLPSILKEY